MTELTARELLIMLYQAALDSVDGRFLVSQWCHSNSMSSQSRGFSHCVAIGKAAPAMLQGVLDSSSPPKKSLLICPPAKITRALKKNKQVSCVTSSHPVPDETSLEAGHSLIRFLSDMDESDELLFLISGGTSALVEIPIEGVSLDQLQRINNYLLASGKDIYQVNAWRQQFSEIKGGGLLKWLKTSSVTQLLLSDVKDDRIEFIGSGLLVDSKIEPDTDAYLSEMLPDNKAGSGETGRATIDRIRVNTHVIGNIKQAMSAVLTAAESEDLKCFIYDEFLEGEASDVAAMLYDRLKDAESGVHIWGGETTVCLPDNPGVGGRSQTLALAFAEHLDGIPDLHLLAAGTDGVDGNSRCAGAVVSMYTSKKAKAMGFDIRQEIEKANAGIVLMATDDLVRGEQSNTNVMDLVIAYKI